MINKELNQLPIMEQFYSVQGEGFYSGRPAYFIRIAGCDVGCTWCDVKESWNANEHEILTISDIVAKVAETKANFVVITGGEPAMYDLSSLTQALKKLNCYLAIETSGVYPLTGTLDWVCFSPKKFKAPHETIYAKADELKVIVFNKHDLTWAEEHAAKLNPKCRIFLQPEWSKHDKLLPIILDYIKENPKWTLSLQTHKYINVP
jgi:7-carboxy-7-deazaguanine synthase